MKCPYCNSELDEDNICNNSSCSNYEKIPLTSFCNDNHIDDDYTKSTDDNTKINFYSLDNDISDEEFIAFVGEKKSSYYIDYFNRYKTNTNFISWNWSSFFFGAYWLLYRKLFLIFFLVILITVSSITLLGPFANLTTIILSLVFGMFGNNIYIRFVEHKILSLRNFSSNINKNISSSLTQSDYIKLLSVKGGTSSILAYGIIILINVLLIFSYT